jgi:hypothetical protein
MPYFGNKNVAVARKPQFGADSGRSMKYLAPNEKEIG